MMLPLVLAAAALAAEPAIVTKADYLLAEALKQRVLAALGCEGSAFDVLERYSTPGKPKTAGCRARDLRPPLAGRLEACLAAGKPVVTGRAATARGVLPCLDASDAAEQALERAKLERQDGGATWVYRSDAKPPFWSFAYPLGGGRSATVSVFNDGRSEARSDRR